MQAYYGVKGLINHAPSDLTFWMMRRYVKEKEFIRKEIESYHKYNPKLGTVSATTNYCEYPYVADVRVKTGMKKIVVLLSMDEQEPILNRKVQQILREAEKYWRGKDYLVGVLHSQKDIDHFIQKQIKAN